MSVRAVFIYALKCPITGSVRYIGMSGNPDSRIKKHLREARVQKNHRANWIRSLLVQNLKPELEILAQVPETGWQQWEIDYISAFRNLGCNLVNGTDGGEGVCNPSQEIRDKRKEKLIGIPRTEELKRKVSAAKRGIPQTMAHRQAVGDALRNKKSSRNTSGFLGITWSKKADKWQTVFRTLGRNHYVGYFKKLEDAVLSRALAVYNYEN